MEKVQHPVVYSLKLSFRKLTDRQLDALVEYVMYLGVRGQTELYLLQQVVDEDAPLPLDMEAVIDEAVLPTAGPAPGSPGALTPEQIWDLVRFVQSLERERSATSATGNVETCGKFAREGEDAAQRYDNTMGILSPCAVEQPHSISATRNVFLRMVVDRN